jgi:hypothetical protein
MKFIIYIFCMYFFFSCEGQKNSFDKDTDTLRDLASVYKKNTSLNKKMYLVTGLDGCGACLEYTVKYIEKQVDNKDMSFIISGESKIQLKSKFSQKTILNKNFVFDTLQVALKNGLVQMAHPKIFLCKSGRVYDTKEINYINADSVFNYVSKELRNN